MKKALRSWIMSENHENYLENQTFSFRISFLPSKVLNHVMNIALKY